MLEIENLRVSFQAGRRRFQAVDDFNLNLRAGERFGLVGESGSGKSTILKAIVGLAPITAGDIRIDGRSVTERPLDWLYQKIQLVFQDPYASLHPRQTIDQILAETLYLRGTSDIDGTIARLLGQVGLGSRHRFRYPFQLSGGQRQRVAIARALAGSPRILLLDEPTSALDVSVQAEVLNLLSDIVAEQKLTMVMVSHDLAVIGHMCQRLAIMRKGQVVEDLSSLELAAGAVHQPYSKELLAAGGGTPLADDTKVCSAHSVANRA